MKNSHWRYQSVTFTEEKLSEHEDIPANYPVWKAENLKVEKSLISQRQQFTIYPISSYFLGMAGGGLSEKSVAKFTPTLLKNYGIAYLILITMKHREVFIIL